MSWNVDLTGISSPQQILDRVIGATQAPTVGNPMSAYRYLDARRHTTIEETKQRPLLRLWDKNMQFIGNIAQEKSVRVEEVMADSGTGTCVIRRDNWLSDFILYDRRAEEDLHFTLDPNPTNRSWRTRWGGKVTGVTAKRSNDGLHTVEMEMVHNREHVKHLLAGANPIFPPEIQFPKMFVLPWNCRTAVSLTMFINLARQFFPLLSIPTNIFNPGAWLGVADIIGGFDPLLWPVQVQFVNPLFDQSRTTILTSRWTDIHTVTAPLLEDAGCMIRAYTWLTEDKDSPHPELGTLAGQLARPHRNAVILAVEDKSGVTGPTGTLLDGPINLIASTADDMITETLSSVIDLDKDNDGETDPLIRKWFGVAPKPPWVVFKDGEYSGIVESQRTTHGATAKTIMIGGRSPGWVNQLQTFGIKYSLSQLSAVISYAIGAYQQPGTPGLEELYQGQLDDTLLAFQRFTDPIRAIRMGDFGFLEHFEQGGGGTAYTVSGILNLRSGHWKTRAYTSFKTSIRNGMPYLLDTDFTLGDRLGFQMANVIHVDQCTAIRRSYDESTPMTIELSIGDDSEEEDPVAKATRTLAAVWGLMGMFLGSSEIF
ncbi:hypothetical protein [Mycobacteroides salmoniphilum]|uniref:Gp28/Gp37-like domain-containing protein n=1 Tax=Mycobacteroides salmoniphilum TaxID=404941 RepID=A0A4R8SVI2_9MYCO|nr:hypothetical protein [Mycobacteroides salmoniphilum]TEA06278.1 hypothetical protein CCUG60884_01416 [Mycobacteroides salmoniphilum]